MGFFGFGKSYTKDDLDREIAKLRTLYAQAMGNPQVKSQLAAQLREVLEVCHKGGFYGGEMVEWPTPGNYTSLRNVTPPVRVLLDMM
ncbi:MAG: hypothetical protein HDS64_07785 [Bacteroidales bacterium]|nr:hypothetical protein [Bacteroidales bacterium]